MRQALNALVAVALALGAGFAVAQADAAADAWSLERRLEVAAAVVEAWVAPPGDASPPRARLRVVGADGAVLELEDAYLRVRGGPDEFPVDLPAGAFGVRFAPGDDLTGDGRANLLVEGFSGGAHCCFTAHLIELAPTPRVLWSADVRDAGVALADLDADGVPELLTADMSFAYEFCSFAESPAPLVVLAWDGATYRVANRDFPRAYDRAIVGALEQVLAASPPASVGGSAGPPPPPEPAVAGWREGACDALHLVLPLLYAGHDAAAERALARFYAGDARALAERVWGIAAGSRWYVGPTDP